MNLSRIVGILALVGQVGNVTLGFAAGFLTPDQVVVVAAVLSAIQAFTARVQGTSEA